MSNRDERRWALRWLGGPIEPLSGERRRELIEAAAARGRLSSRGVMTRLGENWFPVVQTAAAAALAWLLANAVLGHANPVFAPVAAVVSLGATRGQRARRAIELMLGVAVGITAGDLLTSVIGVGVWQLAVIVGLAMAAAVSLGAGLLALSEAGSPTACERSPTLSRAGTAIRRRPCSSALGGSRRRGVASSKRWTRAERR